MGDTAKIIAAAVGGYVLGRKKKFKLALGVGLYLGAKKFDIKPQQLAQGLLKEVSALPVVNELKDQSQEQLLNVGRATAGNLVGKWAGGLADSLNSRTELLREGVPEAAPDGETGDERADEDDDAPGEGGGAAARQEPETDGSGDTKKERPTKPKATKAARGTASGTAKRAKGTAKSTAKGGGKRVSDASDKPARRRRNSTSKDEGGDDGGD